MGSETRASPEFFVLLQSPHDSRFDTEFSIVDEKERTDAPRCPRCGGAVGMLRWLPPYRVKLKLYGQEPGDFARTLGGGSDIIVSERFVEAFQAAQLTGLHGFDPVEVVRVQRPRGSPKSKSPDLPRYFAVTVPFGSALVDETRSHILRPGPFDCDYCRAIGSDGVNGFTLEPESWNGDDAFHPRGLPGTLVVSERFARLVSEHQLTNMVLTPTERYVWDPLRRFTSPPQP